MPSLHESYPEIRTALENGLGPPLPPLLTGDPGISFGVIVAALLSRTYAERQAREIFESLFEAGLGSPEDIAGANVSELVEVTRNLRAPHKLVSAKILKPLIQVCKQILEWGGLDTLDDIATESLRDDLLMIPGLGPASVDALLLYGLKRPVYPVDRATYRILVRHGWLDTSNGYEEARDVVEALEPGDTVRLSELASWFLRLGEVYCKASVAKCERCPLKPFLPESGPIEPNAE
jgi:endonuclease-3 related protein